MFVTGSQNHYHAIPSAIVTHYQNIQPYIAGSGTIDDYLSQTHMDKRGTWGTDKEVLAFSHIICTSAYVYGRDNVQINVKKETVKKSSRATINYGASEWQLFSPSLIDPGFHDDNANKCMYLRQQGRHFEVMLATQR